MLVGSSPKILGNAPITNPRIACYFIFDPKEEFNDHIDEPAEADLVVAQEHRALEKIAE